MKVELIDDIKNSYKYWSVWVFVALGALPDLFNLAVSHGLLESDSAPAFLARTINLVAFLGVASRLIKQKKLELDAQNGSVA